MVIFPTTGAWEPSNVDSRGHLYDALCSLSKLSGYLYDMGGKSSSDNTCDRIESLEGMEE